MKVLEHLARPAAVAAALSLAACAGSGRKPATTGPNPSEAISLLNAEPPGARGSGPLSIRERVPASFPPALIPTGATVAAVGVSGSRTVVVSSIPSKAPFDSVQFEWRLQDAGWTLRSTSFGGFATTSTSLPATTLCRNSDFITVSYRTLTSGERLVRVALGPEPDRSCSPMATPFADVPVPNIVLPSTIRSRPSGSGTGGSRTSRVRLETSMPLQSLADLCVPQLTAVGWKVQAQPAPDRTLSVTRLSARSRTGDPLTALLVFAVLEDDVSVEGMLYIVRDKSSSPIPQRLTSPLDRGPSSVASEAATMMRAGLSRAATEALETRSSAPDSFPSELIYPGSDVVTVGVAPTATVVISVIPANAPFDPARFEWTFEDRGWTPLPVLRLGFVLPGFTPPTHCRGGEFASLSYRTLASGERLARAAVTSETQSRPCAPSPNRALNDVPMPRLELPPEVVSFGGGGGSGGSFDAGAQSRFSSPLPVGALAALCVPQMQAAGWVREGNVSTPGSTVVTRYVTKSRSGQPVTAILAFTALGDSPAVDAMIAVSVNTPTIR